jgi:hypothetical protein
MNYSITSITINLNMVYPLIPMTPKKITPSEHSVPSNTLKDEYIMVMNIVTS